MYLPLIGLFLRAAGTTFIPWLIPFLYAAIAGLIIQGMDPLLLSLVLGVGALFGTTVLWFVDRYLDTYVDRRFSELGTYTCKTDTRFGRITKRMHDRLHIVSKKPMLFSLSCFMTWSAIPDLFVIRCVRKRLGFPLFFIATIIGKIFVYTPVIYGAELIDLLVTKFM